MIMSLFKPGNKIKLITYGIGILVFVSLLTACNYQATKAKKYKAETEKLKGVLKANEESLAELKSTLENNEHIRLSLASEIEDLDNQLDASKDNLRSTTLRLKTDYEQQLNNALADIPEGSCEAEVVKYETYIRYVNNVRDNSINSMWEYYDTVQEPVSNPRPRTADDL